MTEGDKNEVKFEIEKFKAQKRTKFVVQVGLLKYLIVKMSGLFITNVLIL